MPRIYSIARRLWLSTPESVKRAIRANTMINEAKKSLSVRLLNMRTHEEIYDADYFNEIDSDPQHQLGMDKIAETIMKDLEPQSVIDVGCGTGALLKRLQNRGVRGVGLEYSESALTHCRAQNLTVEKYDLENSQANTHKDYDVVISIEVAEHLPERVADRYVDLLTSAGRLIIFTAAHPGQGGHDHVNEQPKDYWIEKFTQRGFWYDTDLTLRWQQEWSKTDMAYWYHHNLMIFNKNAQPN